MTVLSSKKILQEKNTSDPDAITSLSLTHKALSDVSCLSEFKNLERLDLGFNNLTSLEGLKSCVNLKWLSVVQNKLHSLKGVEGLTKLTVLNAGKNKLKSMDEVKSLASLRALILNDNEISSVCKLDQMKELNTLVLSRNPISSLGDSLVKLKSITKLSLSNCQLQTVDSSLKSCLELKELRLAHNEIMNVPSEFGHLVKLQNLDMGNNLITNWSNLKVLSSLVNLRNLNLQGNPIAEKEKLQKKVSLSCCNLRKGTVNLFKSQSNCCFTRSKIIANLHIFNARPIDKVVGKEVHEKVDGFSGEADLIFRNKKKELPDEKGVDSAENTEISEKQMKKKWKLQQNESVITNNAGKLNVNSEEAKKSKHKKLKTNEHATVFNGNLDVATAGKEPDKKSRKKNKGDRVNIIDSAESPFMDLFVTDGPEAPQETADKKFDHRTLRDIDAISGLVTVPTKKKKRNRVVDPAALEVSQVRYQNPTGTLLTNCKLETRPADGSVGLQLESGARTKMRQLETIELTVALGRGINTTRYAPFEFVVAFTGALAITSAVHATCTMASADITQR
ncbi:hypothetical protein DH2020_021013 [Rehmannia glutinosa]|uniref:Protein phosphatase 1 regulatory subunit 7 n=1 Tax=Rehmannia glutinosa TaxID=99300 RepID=A0ABR0W9S5_REHGL